MIFFIHFYKRSDNKRCVEILFYNLEKNIGISMSKLDFKNLKSFLS